MNEINLLSGRLKDLNNLKTNSPQEQIAYKKMIHVVDDYLANGNQSKYFVEIPPHNIKTQSTSQVRRVTIEPTHLKKVADSIEARQKVLFPILTALNANGEPELWNGNHRHQCCVDLVNGGKLSKNFKIPSIQIPAEDFSDIYPIMTIIQSILNDHPPALSSNKNDLQKEIANICRPLSLDLSDADDYERVFCKLRVMFPDFTDFKIKYNMTSVKNKEASKNSDVICDKPENFLNTAKTSLKVKGDQDQYSFRKEGNSYRKCTFRFVSTKGSSEAQLFTRDNEFRHQNPGQKLVYFFACQENGGNSSQTIKSRANFFKRLYNQFVVFGRNPQYLNPDVILIIPQNKSDFEFRLAADQYLYRGRPENIHSQKDYILITKQEVLNHWSTNPVQPFKIEWLGDIYLAESFGLFSSNGIESVKTNKTLDDTVDGD